MFNYDTAKINIESGASVTRSGWGSCKIVRKATLADEDVINYPHGGLLVETCERRVCDCPTAIFQPTEEDIKAEDYIIV